MKSLSTLPTSCSLDAQGAEAQGERYRRIGAGGRLIETTTRSFALSLRLDVAAGDVEEAIAVERECCPFFEISWDPDRRRLAFGVTRDEDGPALDAIAHALGIEEARRPVTPPG